MADITVDVWEDFEFATVNAANLAASDHVAVGTWTVVDASSKLTTSASAERVSDGTFSTNSDSAGAKGLAYNTSGGAAGYVEYTFSATKTAVSFGFWHQFSSGIVGTFGEHDILSLHTDIGTDDVFIKLADQEEGTSTGVRIHAFTPSQSYTTGIVVSANTWYWVTVTWIKNTTGGVKLRVYDTSGVQVGSEQTRNTPATDNLHDLELGSLIGGPSVVGSLWFDDLIVDYADATFPLGPPSASGGTSPFAGLVDGVPSGKSSPRDLRTFARQSPQTQNADVLWAQSVM